MPSKHIIVYTSHEQWEILRQMAGDFGYRWGANPSITGLMKAIADGKLIVNKPGQQSHGKPSNGSIAAIKAADPLELARIHANIAHSLVEADCYEQAETHVLLAHTFALIGTDKTS